MGVSYRELLATPLPIITDYMIVMAGEARAVRRVSDRTRRAAAGGKPSLFDLPLSDVSELPL